MDLKQILLTLLNPSAPCATQRILDHLSGQDLDDETLDRAFFIHLENSHSSPFSHLPDLEESERAKILAAFEFAKRYLAFRSNSPRTQKPWPGLLSASRACLAKVPAALRTEPREWLGFVPIYQPGIVGELCVVERGVRTHVNVEPAELFSRILMLRPRGFALFHNHPSGDPTPSGTDLELTEQVRKVANGIQIEFVGHWVIGLQSEWWIPPIRNLRKRPAYLQQMDIDASSHIS